MVMVKGPVEEVDLVKDAIDGAIGNLVASDTVSVETAEREIAHRTPTARAVNHNEYSSGQLVRKRGEITQAVPPELLSWEKDESSGGYIAVIKKHNLTDFYRDRLGHSTGDSTPGRFFNALVYHGDKNQEMGELYLYPSDVEARQSVKPEEIYIKASSSLEILRRLKHQKIGSNPNRTGLWTVGPVSVDLFEKYCESLFPGVDIDLATRELDHDLLEKLLNRSQKRAKVWSWAVERTVGSAFRAQEVSDITADVMIAPNEAGNYLHNLQALGFIDRRPQIPYMGSHDYPFEKLPDSRWEDLKELLISRGEMPDTS